MRFIFNSSAIQSTSGSRGPEVERVLRRTLNTDHWVLINIDRGLFYNSWQPGGFFDDNFGVGWAQFVSSDDTTYTFHWLGAQFETMPYSHREVARALGEKYTMEKSCISLVTPIQYISTAELTKSKN